MKYTVEIDDADVAGLTALFPLRNRRKRELKEAKEQLKDYLHSKQYYKDGLWKCSRNISTLEREIKRAQSLYDINEGTMHVILDDLEVFLNNIEKQIKSKE